MASSDKNVRAMTDANILFSGVAFPRWPREVLRHAVKGDYQLVLCPIVIEEARRVTPRAILIGSPSAS